MLVGGFRRALGVYPQKLARGFADSEKDIKYRIKSVTSTGKITKAMKMVATAKMKAETDRLANGKEFGVHFVSTMFENDEYMLKKVGEPEINKTLLVPITTDRYFKVMSEVFAVVSTLLLSEIPEISSTRMTSPNTKSFVLVIRELQPFPEVTATSSSVPSMKSWLQSISTYV